jgi:hypothetical protein
MQCLRHAIEATQIPLRRTGLGRTKVALKTSAYFLGNHFAMNRRRLPSVPLSC